MKMTRRDVLGAATGLAVAARFGAIDPARGAGPTPSAIPPGEAREARTPDGLRLSVRVYGDPARPEILFLHGLNQCRLSWDRQVGALAGRFRVVTFDLRGHGDSDKPADEAAYWDGGRWADDVAAVVDAAGLRRPTLVGWSIGGLVVGHYLARHGHGRVAGVNLVNAVTKQAAELLGEAANDFAPKLGSPDLAVRARATADFLAVCFAEAPPRDEFARMLAYNGMAPAALQRGILPISGGEKLDEAWAGVARLLVTYGARDVLTRPAMSERLLGLNPRARLSTYPEAGHSPFYEDAARFNRELADFAAGSA